MLNLSKKETLGLFCQVGNSYYICFNMCHEKFVDDDWIKIQTVLKIIVSIQNNPMKGWCTKCFPYGVSITLDLEIPYTVCEKYKDLTDRYMSLYSRLTGSNQGINDLFLILRNEYRD